MKGLLKLLRDEPYLIFPILIFGIIGAALLLVIGGAGAVALTFIAKVVWLAISTVWSTPL